MRALADIDRMINQQAYTLAVIDVFDVSAMLLLVLVVVVRLTNPRRARPTKPLAATRTEPLNPYNRCLYRGYPLAAMQEPRNTPSPDLGCASVGSVMSRARLTCSRPGPTLLAGVFHKAVSLQRRFLLSAALLLAPALSHCTTTTLAQTPTQLRLLTHSSFDLPKELLAGFEQQHGVKLQIVKAGDAGEMVNKLILTRARPIADLVFGIDNTLLPRAQAAGVFEAYTGPAAQRAAAVNLDAGVVPVDYGYVNLNVDKAWFANKGLALPASLADLTKPAYTKLLVVPNPATSSPGQAFLLATIAGLGEAEAFDWWARMRTNGMKVVKGWSEAYYTEFSRNGGTRPIVVGYTSSPAAEVFYSKEAISESPTANLFLEGGVFRQVEGVALVKGGNPAAREAASQFIEFLRSAPVQQALQTTMWVFPAEAGAPRVEVMQRYAVEPSRFDALTQPLTPLQAKAWLQRWSRTVLK